MSWAQRVTLLCASSGLGLSVFAGTSVTLALPSIQREFDASGSELQWVVNLFVLVHASLIVAGGGIGDARGRKGLFLVGAACFGIGSAICALAPALPILLGGRVVQGLGPAMMLPAGLAILTTTFSDRRQRAAAVGIWSAVAGLASTLGPPLGGLLVDAFGWRSVFLINVPLAALVFAVAAATLTRLPRLRTAERFDSVGTVLAVLSLLALCGGLIEGRVLGWGSPVIIAVLAFSVVGLVSFVLWENRHPAPLVDLSLFRDRWFAVPTAAAIAGFFGFMAMPIYLSLYFPAIADLSPVATGLRLLPMGIAAAVAAPVGGFLVGRVGPRWPLFGGFAIAAVGLGSCLRLGLDPPESVLIWEFVLIGAGGGLALPPMTSASVNAVDASRVGTASAIHNAARQIGFVLGIAVLGSILYATMDATLDQSLATRGVAAEVRGPVVSRAEAGLSLTVKGMPSKDLEAASDAAFVDGLHAALIAATIPVALMALLTLTLLSGPQPATSPSLSRDLTLDQL